MRVICVDDLPETNSGRVCENGKIYEVLGSRKANLVPCEFSDADEICVRASRGPYKGLGMWCLKSRFICPSEEPGTCE